MNYGPMVGEKVRRLRESRHWSQRDLANRAGVSNGYLSRLERGAIKYPSVTILNKIATPIGVPLSELTDHVQPLDINAEVIQDMARRIAIILPNVQLDDVEEYVRRTASLPPEGQSLMENLLYTVENHYRTNQRKRDRTYELKVESDQSRVLGNSEGESRPEEKAQEG